MSLLPGRSDTGDDCRCTAEFVEPSGTGIQNHVELRIDADDCPGNGDLAASPACRGTAVDAMENRTAEAVRVRSGGYERCYTDDAVALLHAAGRFSALAAHHDAGIAATARTDPLAAAHEATGRAGPIGRLAAETGLTEGAARATNYVDALRSHDGPTIAQARVDHRLPADARLRDTTSLSTGAEVRRYALEPDAEIESDTLYHLTPESASFGDDTFELLDEAAQALADSADSGALGPARAVRQVAGPDDPVEKLSTALRKHTRGNGVLTDVFADQRVSDAYVTAPAAETPVRVVVDGETMPTNVRLTPDGVGTLASRIRRASGRAFSRASPEVDATLRIGDPSGDGPERVRVAGITRPLSPGTGFAIRRHDSEPWTLPRLVATESLTPRAAALLSLAVERGGTGLVAGARGAGKTTTLGALLWALPHRTRTVLIEDTPELPATALRAAGRDVQSLRVARGDDASGETSPESALRTALRLGDGALVVGEVRGEEAGTLYEAMRVGAASGTVLGTVHGDGATAVRTRMTEDLGVSESAFAATGFVLTVADTERGRRAVAIEEVAAVSDGTQLFPLFALGDDGDLEPTGRLDRGESTLLTDLALPDQQYGDVLDDLRKRTEQLRSLAADGVTRPAAIRAEQWRSEPSDSSIGTDGEQIGTPEPW